MDNFHIPYQTLITTLLASFILQKLIRTFYDVFLGPLSKIPGPKLAAATRLVFVYHKLIGNGERWLAQLHRTYGDVIRPAPGEVSLASGNDWKSIYGHIPGTTKAALAKDPKFYYRDSRDRHIAAATDDDHTRHRKHFAHAFSDKSLAQQEPIIQQYIDQLISNLRQNSPREDVDMVQNFNFTTFDIMADLMFGEPLGCLQNSEYTPWVSTVFSSVTVITFLIEINYTPILRTLFNALLPASLKKKADDHYQHSVDRVNKRLAQNIYRPDIIGLIQQVSTKNEEKLSLDEIYANASVLMFAGTETTATLLSGLTYYLLTNPATLDRLTKEIRSSFNSDKEINLKSTSKLPYLAACIQEGLRIYPPVPMGLPRLVGKEGIELDGFYLPEQTLVYIHLLSTFHNPKNFARADAFVPERWMKDDTLQEFVGDKRPCLQPFSVGPRNCVGINLAYLEMRLILTHVLYNFDLTLCDDDKMRNWAEQRTFCLWEKHPLMVRLKDRHVM